MRVEVEMRSWMLALGLSGCGLRGDDDGAFELMVAGDTDELARQVVSATSELEGQELSATGQVEGVGDCTWTWSVQGPREGATLEASIDALPCGGTGTGERLDWVYEVQSGEVGGTIGLGIEGDPWAYELSGSRSAEFTATTARRSQTYDASLELLSLVGTTDGENPAFEAEARYLGWLGGSWSLSWSVAEDQSVSGTAVGPERTCVLGGVRGAVEVECE
jgi:hypothetical protein